MNILSLFTSFVNYLNQILGNNLFMHELEHHISDATYNLNLETLKNILEFLDLEYKNSKERKEKYYVQQTRERTLITSLGIITFNKSLSKSFLLEVPWIGSINYLPTSKDKLLISE